MKRKPCVTCGRPFQANNGAHCRCRPCSLINQRASTRAHARVARAVAAGELPDLKAEVIPCADCAAQSVHYDHRDYGRPTDVEPVCHSCNLRRGPATLPVRDRIEALVGVVCLPMSRIWIREAA